MDIFEVVARLTHPGMTRMEAFRAVRTEINISWSSFKRVWPQVKRDCAARELACDLDSYNELSGRGALTGTPDPCGHHCHYSGCPRCT